MSYYPQPENRIRDKVRLILYLSDYATKKNYRMLQALMHPIYLLKKCVALKAEIEKLDINKLAIVPTSLNNLKISIYDLDVGKLKTAPVDLKKLSDLVSKVVKNTKFKTLNTKVNELEKIPVESNLTQTNQYNTDKKNLEKKLKMLRKK